MAEMLQAQASKLKSISTVAPVQEKELTMAEMLQAQAGKLKSIS